MLFKNRQHKAQQDHVLNALVKGFNAFFQGVSVLVLLLSLFIGLNLTLVQSAQAETIITNTASAHFSINGNAQTLSDSVSFTKDIVVTPPDQVTLQKQANRDSANVGETIRYSLTINNPNNHILNNVSIQDTLPTGLIYKTGSASYADNATHSTLQISQSANLLSFTVGNMPANSSWVLTYLVDITSNTPAGVATNQAVVHADTADSTPAQAAVTISAVVQPTSPILLSKNADKSTAKIGDLIHYSLNIKNPNNHQIVNIHVNDTLPSGLIYQTGSARLQKTANTNIAINANTSNGLDFALGNIPANRTWVLSYDALVKQSNSSHALINQAQVNTNDNDANSSLATATVKVRTPSTIDFLKIDDAGVVSVVPPASYNDNQNGGRHWQEINSITLSDGSSINLPTPLPLIEAQEYGDAEPIVIQVTDLDQNLDSSKQETIIVTVSIPGTNDKEVLLLTETSPDSGIFRGIILTTTDATTVQNGRLSIRQGSKITVNYRDEEDISDVSATAALIVPKKSLLLTKTADKNQASIGELVRYTLEFDNPTNKSLSNVTLNDTLPLGVRYVQGSANLNGTTLHNEISAKGRKLVFNLNNMPSKAHWSIEYLTKITAGVQSGKIVNHAQIISDGLASNIAHASVLIKDDLMRDKNILTGRVYLGCKTGKDAKVLKNTRLYLETGRSVLSDEEGFWHMEGVEPGAHVVQLDTESLPRGYQVQICQGNTRYAGDAQSRFVDLQAGALWQVDFHVKVDPNSSAADSNKKQLNPVEQYGQSFIEKTTKDFDILWPKNDYVPVVASTKIIVKAGYKQRIEVYLNKKKVSPLNFDGTINNKSKTVSIKRWVGVDLDIKNRNNSLLVILKNKAGKELARKTRNIHFSGEPASAEFLPEKSYLIADGKTIPVIAFLIRDEDGFPMRANTHGYFTLDDGNYQIKTLDQDKDKLNLNKSIAGEYKYLIGKDGIAKIQLNPTTQSGEVKLRFQFNKKSTTLSRTSISRSSKSNRTVGSNKIVSVWLKPHLRKWILVGLAEGSLGYSTLSGNLQNLKDLDKEDKFYKRGRVSFFAKGRVKGKYLLTIAYDTHKKKQRVGSQLDGNIDPDAWYTIYADNSNNQYDAPSSRKLYVKIEKENFYALFGDYHTGLSVTELAKYNRVLNGIKTEYKDKRYSVNAFVSETSNKHQHLEIPGDGTSGLYHLTRDIVPNSEQVKIETRDRYHSDRIIETRVLTRFQDYDIDYTAGTLFFKFPVTGRDQHFNPNIIVVDFDNEDEDANKSITAGGRIAVKSKNQRLEVGISAIHEGRNKGKDDQLVAVDASYKITPDTKIHAEIATSSTQASGHKSKQAYVIELEKEIANMEARIYLKKNDSNFGISAQASEDSIRKAGAEVRYKLNKKTNINAEVSHQKNLSNKNERQLAQVDVEHRLNKQTTLSAGARHTKETIDDKSTNNDALLVGGKYTTKNGKISFRSNIEKNINNNNGSELSPDRAVVGVDVKLKQGFSVFAEHETTDNGKQTTHNNRVGVTKSLWKGATAKSTYTQERTDQGQREYATIGLNQKVKVTDKIHADFSIDQAKTIKDSRTSQRFNDNEPAIQGSQRDDYTAFAVGLGANDKDWSWTTRFELRDGEINDKLSFRAGLIRHLDDGKNLSAKASYYRSENDKNEFENRIKISLGSAWHPKNKDFVFLNRLDLVDEDNSYSGDAFADFNGTNGSGNGSGLENHTQKIIHNMHYNRKINDKTQISIHHGIKHVREDNKNNSHSTTVDTATVEVRRDINSKWDVGVHGGYLNDWGENKVETLAGVSVGVTPAENAWLSLGYNFEGFDDKDFDKSDHKRQGAYVDFKYKFNQDSFDGKDLPIRKKAKSKNKIDKTSNQKNSDTADSGISEDFGISP